MSESSSCGCSRSSSSHFTWIIKSCFPNPHQQISASSTFINKSTTTMSCLPDDILLEILTRVPTSSLPSLSSVCRRWSLLLLSPSFLSLRRRLLLLHHHPPSLFFFSPSSLQASSLLLLFSSTNNYTFSFQGPWILPSTFRSGSGSGPLSVSLPYVRMVSVGPSVFIIRPTDLLCYHSWTRCVSPRSPMLHSRKRFAAASFNRKIYVAGGSTPAVEEYDIDANVWRVVSHSPRRRYGCVGVAVDGVFFIIGGLKIGGSSVGNKAVARAPPPMSAGAAEANLYASSMDLYDVDAGVWLRSRAVPGGGCIVAACSVGRHVYILASHAVELSFWRFDARRRQKNDSSSGGGGGGGVGVGTFGEWCRIQSPPLGAQVRLDNTVRFSCVGVEDKVVLIQVIGSVDDHARGGRYGHVHGGLRDRVIFFYDTVTAQWSRGPDLPDVLGTAACVCVDC